MLPRSFVTCALPLAAAATLVMGATACTGDDDPSTSTPTTTRPSTSTTAEADLTDEQQIEQLLEEWFVVVEEIFALERPVESADTYLTGDYLSGLNESFDLRMEEGYRLDRSEASAQVIESIDVDGDRAIAVLCITDASADVVIETGEVVDSVVTTTRFRDALSLTSGGWRANRREAVEALGGPEACEESAG